MAAGCTIYFASVQTAADTLVKEHNVIEATKGHNAEQLMGILNTFCNKPQKINAATIYAISGEIISSPLISGNVPLKSLVALPAMQEFMISEQAGFFLFRNTTIAAVYEGNAYRTDRGMISYVSKIYSGQDIIGYLFADIMPSALYSRYLTIEGGYTYIGMNANYSFPAPNPNAPSGYFTQSLTGKSVSKDGKYFLHNVPFYSGSITLAESLSPYKATVAVLSISLLICTVFSLTIVYFISMLMAGSITKRLIRLHNKMKNL